MSYPNAMACRGDIPLSSFFLSFGIAVASSRVLLVSHFLSNFSRSFRFWIDFCWDCVHMGQITLFLSFQLLSFFLSRRFMTRKDKKPSRYSYSSPERRRRKEDGESPERRSLRHPHKQCV